MENDALEENMNILGEFAGGEYTYFLYSHARFAGVILEENVCGRRIFTGFTLNSSYFSLLRSDAPHFTHSFVQMATTAPTLFLFILTTNKLAGSWCCMGVSGPCLWREGRLVSNVFERFNDLYKCLVFDLEI
jgi:hypothetical protein